MNRTFYRGLPEKHGLYDPANEKDSCGVGFIAHIKGERSHSIVRDADEALSAMDHRGACGCEANTGDGAGILTAIPDELMRAEAERLFKFALPEEGKYAIAQIFLPQDDADRELAKKTLRESVESMGAKFIGWRRVPTDVKEANIGPSAAATEPVVEQLFITAGEGVDRTTFCRQLYLIRKIAYHKIKRSIKNAWQYYTCSFSMLRLILW
jgi:glutamate synthase (NADPH/NADH) large chain